MHNAEWLIEAWTADGKAVREQLAYCKCFACAEAAYEAAIIAYPYDRVTFRHGVRLIRENRGKWTPGGKR